MRKVTEHLGNYVTANVCPARCGWQPIAPFQSRETMMVIGFMQVCPKCGSRLKNVPGRFIVRTEHHWLWSPTVTYPGFVERVSSAEMDRLVKEIDGPQ